MKKLIDFDELFDRKLAQYMEEHAGEYTEKQWEDLIPRLYRNFGDTLIKSVGTTPKGYYAEMTDEELVDTLKAHHKEGVSVSDFLCRELESRGCPDALLVLMQEAEGELLTLTINLAGSSKKALPVYLGILLKTALGGQSVMGFLEPPGPAFFLGQLLPAGQFPAHGSGILQQLDFPWLVPLLFQVAAELVQVTVSVFLHHIDGSLHPVVTECIYFPEEICGPQFSGNPPIFRP